MMRRLGFAVDPRSGIRSALIHHGYRGFSLQMTVRAVLVLFIVFTLVLEPPDNDLLLCAGIAVGYVVLTIGAAFWLTRNELRAATNGWLMLYLDLAALSGLTLVSGISASQSWTSDILLRGFFLLPLLAATQLRLSVCLGVVVPATLVYLLDSILTRQANDEPWSSLWLRTLVMVGVSGAAVGLTMIQRSRVRTIESLLATRTALLAELTTVSAQERRALAEDLHDGALQYLLGARFDVEDLRDMADPTLMPVVDRLDRAVTESSVLLRNAVTELHPAVLEAAGLATAVSALARTAADRGGLELELDVAGWPEQRRDPSDGLLFRSASELIANVIKHAGASSIRIELGLEVDGPRLVVSDDGAGIDENALAQRIRDGHIGLQSNRVRIESAGGSVQFSGLRPQGTRVEVRLPPR